MSDERLRLLIEALAGQLPKNQKDPTGTVAVLISETVKYRDKLKEEAGIVLTVEDTRIALDALQARLIEMPQPEQLSPTQKELAQILFDRLNLRSD
jgi:hypothetical protein